MVPHDIRTAERLAIVLNGNAKQVDQKCVDELVEVVREGDLFVSHSLEEGRRIAQRIVERGYQVVLTGGGDGTFVQMVTWISDAAHARGQPTPRIGLLRLGTGNALAWSLGAKRARGNVASDLGRLRTEGGARNLRLIAIQGMLTPFAGLGLDANALSHYADMRAWMNTVPPLRPFAQGAIAYALTIGLRTLPRYLFEPHPEVRVTTHAPAYAIDSDGHIASEPLPAGTVIFEGPSRLTAMSTIPYWGFGAKVFPSAEERDDCFQLRLADITSAEAVSHFRGLWRGTYRSPTIHDFLVSDISLNFHTPMPLQIGGDLAGSHREVRAKLSDRPVQVVDFYAPPGATSR